MFCCCCWQVDQLENSFSSTDSASRTLRSGQLAQMVQKQPQYDQPSSALASVLRETRDSENLRIDSLLESLPPNTSMNSKKLQFSPNQTNASANLNEQSNNANELTNYSIQRLGLFNYFSLKISRYKFLNYNYISRSHSGIVKYWQESIGHFAGRKSKS